ncbi:MAG: M28 family peptidase [Planctomycetota bacterium]|jgi:Zn-dependent M28 family amino/carboxypeptidase
MIVRFPLCAVAAVVAVSLPLRAQSTESVDTAAVEFLRQEGLERSQVMDHLSWICDVFGGRLTGSPNIRRAQDWALGRLRELGLADVREDEWGPFGRSWRLVEFAMKVEGENPWPVLAWPKAWSPSLQGEISAQVIDADALSADELRAIDLTDKIVLTESARPIAEWFVGTGHRFTDSELLAMADGRSVPPRDTGQPGSADFRTGFAKRQAMMALFEQNRPLLMLDRSYKGDSGTLFVTGATAFPGADGERVRAQQQGADVVPQATLAVEHYNRIVRLLQKGLPVRMTVRLQVEMGEDEVMDRNLLAEIPGAGALADEVVMLGAHFDSWHSAGGTTDNGCGSAVMIEAMRILRRLVDETGRVPQRTIRLALWSGEEQGLLGSRAYVAEHVAERGEPPVPLALHDKISCYLNLDNGTGRIRGVYLEGNEAVAPIFRAWLRPFHDIGATTINLGNTGGTDHLAFDAVGVPGFQFIQDPVSYSTRTHHSNMDHVDHAVPEDLMQAATVIASCAWHAANRAEMLPRKGR